MTPLEAAVLDRPASATTPLRPSPAAAQFRVLVADDERDVVEAVRLLLAAHDLAVTPASSPAEAIAAARVQPLDAALIDLNYEKGRTNGDQGLELISALRRAVPALPVVVMTAWSSIELALEAMRRGARDFIEKPWNDSRLVALMRSQAELGRALRRVGELETEVRTLKGTGADGQPNGTFTSMRLLEVEGHLVRQAMERHQGNVSRAARTLGLSRSALYRRLERHKI
jgi:DNA-binding NtrC family response regulator